MTRSKFVFIAAVNAWTMGVMIMLGCSRAPEGPRKPPLEVFGPQLEEIFKRMAKKGYPLGAVRKDCRSVKDQLGMVQCASRLRGFVEGYEAARSRCGK